jgi:hypothetical protein
MKLNGQKICPNEVPVVLPRPDEDVVFILKPVQDVKLFEKMCPCPLPPVKKMKDGEIISNFEDPQYKKAMEAWAVKKESWYIVKSVSETPGLEWESVKLEDHTTWNSWREELLDSGLNEAEVQRIYMGMLEANSLSESAMVAARKRFLASRQQEANASFCPTAEKNSTQSGVLASGGE